MNKVVLIGRLTKIPELKTTSSQTAVATFTVAVDRRFKSASGEHQADFISCVAWRQQAEFVEKYFGKGSRIGIVGSIQTRNWEDKDGHKRTTTEVVADEIEFVESKTNQQQAPKVTQNPVQDDDFGTDMPFDL